MPPESLPKKNSDLVFERMKLVLNSLRAGHRKLYKHSAILDQQQFLSIPAKNLGQNEVFEPRRKQRTRASIRVNVDMVINRRTLKKKKSTLVFAKYFQSFVLTDLYLLYGHRTLYQNVFTLREKLEEHRMVMEQIRQYFENSVRLTDQDWQLFSSKLIKQEFPKNYILLKQGQTEDYLSFIESGMVRFYIPKDGNDLTFSFAFDRSFVSGYDSFLTQKHSTYNIETLTKATLWRLTYNDLQSIYAETKIGNTIGRQASEDLFLRKTKRELSLLNETAEQRYLNLFTEQPRLIKQIPLKYIASYIGITPQALSRIRKRIS